MLILHDASERKLKELVTVSIELNKVLAEHCADAPKFAPDNANVLKDALDEVIARRKEQIDKIRKREKGAEQIVLRRACSELKKEYEQYNQLMEELYGEELLPATIPELLIGSVKRATLEMKESNQTLQNIKEAMKPYV